MSGERRITAATAVLASAQDELHGHAATLDDELKWQARGLVKAMHHAFPAGTAVVRAQSVVSARIALSAALRDTVAEIELAITREKRELAAQLHEYKIMFAPHCRVSYPKAHPDVRRPTREPTLPDSMQYVDVSHLPLRPDTIDIESGRQPSRPVCYIVAPLAAYAHRRPELMLNCVRLNHRGKVVVTCLEGNICWIAGSLPTADRVSWRRSRWMAATRRWRSSKRPSRPSMAATRRSTTSFRMTCGRGSVVRSSARSGRATSTRTN